jgi:hypothetical protein
MEERKYKEEMDTHMIKAPQVPQIQQVPQMVEAPHMYQMPPMPQMAPMPQMIQAPQMPAMCCPYLMNMQCPMIQMPGTCGTGQTYMPNPYMYGPYGW